MRVTAAIASLVPLECAADVVFGVDERESAVEFDCLEVWLTLSARHGLGVLHDAEIVADRIAAAWRAAKDFVRHGYLLQLIVRKDLFGERTKRGIERFSPATGICE